MSKRWRDRLARVRDVVAETAAAANTSIAPVLAITRDLAPVVADHPAVRVLGAVAGTVSSLEAWSGQTNWYRYETPIDLTPWVDLVDQVLDSYDGTVIPIREMAVYRFTYGGETVGFMTSREDRISREIRPLRGCRDRVRAFFSDRFDEILDPVVRVTTSSSHSGLMPEDRFIVQSHTPEALPSPLARSVLDRLTRVLTVADHRSVLLHGRPGVGKSVAAAWIASCVARGRVVYLAPGVVGDRDEIPGLDLLRPDVVVVDELDKIEIRTGVMDQLRRVARVVLYTANNGTDDRYVDGSIARCGRIDESVGVDDIGIEIAEDTLPDWIADEAANWPAAALVELRLRLHVFGPSEEDVAIDDIRERVAMRSRSPKGR